MKATKKRATTSRPWYSRGMGGMETLTSAVSKATSASTSPDSHARTNFATSARSAREFGAGGGSRSPIGGRRRLQAGAGPFQDAVDRFDGRVEHVGDFVGVVSEYLAQDQQYGSVSSRNCAVAMAMR